MDHKDIEFALSAIRQMEEAARTPAGQMVTAHIMSKGSATYPSGHGYIDREDVKFAVAAIKQAEEAARTPVGQLATAHMRRF